ncbi:MAG: class I SAM-dependent methyltransferase [Pseudomonadota bacterium]|nr:class I SAM-dependent methyltransferase [Pseudomonadota bacterium]
MEDRTYTERFGGREVTHSDVLHISAGHPLATVVGDLADAPQIASDQYDCVILTQTLQYIYDTRAAVRTLLRILKPGGTLLATFPGLSRTADLGWNASWYWNLTSRSAKRLFEEVFSAGNVEVEASGNLFAATAFLHGLAQSDLAPGDLEPNDEEFEVTIAVRARK